MAIPLDTATRKTMGVHRATVTPRLPSTPSQPIHLPKTTASRVRHYLNNPAVTNTTPAPTSTHHQRPFTRLKRVPLGAHSLRHNLPLPAHRLAATLKTRRYLDNSAWNRFQWSTVNLPNSGPSKRRREPTMGQSPHSSGGAGVLDREAASR